MNRSSRSRAGEAYHIRYYPPDLTQAEHRHDRPHVSVLIAGSVLEDSEGGQRGVAAGSAVFREAGFGHKVQFGPAGALILSATFGEANLSERLNWPSSDWSIVAPRLISAAVRSAAGDDQSAVMDSVWDLIAAGKPERRPAPDWLLRAREELIEENGCIADIARRNGVHRVHFSRVFMASFGEPPSVHRSQMRALKAAAAAARGESGAAAAQQSGFFDQSHMCRSLRGLLGATFTQLLPMAGQVTTVQAS